MGWVWRDDDDSRSPNSGDMVEFRNPNTSSGSGSGSGDHCSTRRIVKTMCNMEEVEPGKFIRKCETTEQILRYCVGKPTEIVQSNKEYTEEDVTDEVTKGSSHPSSSDIRPFEFPGLRSDIKAIENSIFGGINSLFEAADEMRNEFFRAIDNHPSLSGKDSSSSSTSRRRVVPFEGNNIEEKEPNANCKNSDSGSLDLPSLAREV